MLKTIYFAYCLTASLFCSLNRIKCQMLLPPMYSGKESETGTRLSKRRHDYLCFTAQHDFAPMSAVQQLSVFLQDCGLGQNSSSTPWHRCHRPHYWKCDRSNEQGDSGTDRNRKNVCPPHVSEKFLS